MKASLSIQWHITSKCMKHCRHCYMYEEEHYKEEIDNELNLDKIIEILNDIEDFEKKWNFSVKDFFITGGDPFLNGNYKEILLELKRREKRIYIMGNPETLTDEVLEFLKSLDIVQFQMSLDGLEETHDFYRGKGSFKSTIEALELLDKYGIIGTIMFTLTGENKDELIPLLNYVAYNTKSKGFAFDIVCGVGNAKDISLQLSKYDVKKYFDLYLKEKIKIRNSGNLIRISEKPKFFQLLHYENDEFNPYSIDSFSAIGGCYVGFTSYTILPDGSVLACRRFPKIIGKMPNNKLEDIFLSNTYLKKFRRANSYQTCGHCMFFKSCRGCPAVAFGYTGDAFSDNPLCFKDLLSKKVYDNNFYSPPLDTTKEEEAELIRSIISNQYAADYDNFISNEDVIVIIGTLLSNKEERKTFLKNPKEYVSMNNYKGLDDKDIAYICYYIEAVLQSRIPNPIKYALDIY